MKLNSSYLDGIIKSYESSLVLELGLDRSHIMKIISNYPLFKGFEYDSDFSGNFSDNSLVNKK